MLNLTYDLPTPIERIIKDLLNSPIFVKYYVEIQKSLVKNYFLANIIRINTVRKTVICLQLLLPLI